VKNSVRRYIGWGIYLVSIILAIEFLLRLFWVNYIADRIQYHEYVDLPEAIRLTEVNDFDTQRYDFDPSLGWTNRPGKGIDKDGARLSSYKPVRQIIHAYGDSFVFGADVKPDQSFSHYLSILTKSDVRNFGVGGYGPDQAMLLLERNLAAGISAPIIILGMPSENIARTVSMFWKLYVPITSPFQMKPLFVKEQEKWRTMDAVPDSLSNTEQFLEAATLAQKHDFWYAQNQSRPKFSFPYIWATLSTIKFLAFDVVRWQDLYQNDRAVGTMTHVLDRFIALSRKYNFKPVFTIIPMPEDLMLRDRGQPGYYTPFLDGIQNRFGKEIITINGISEEAVSKDFNVKPYSGHASAYGNNVIAETIHQTLLEFGIEFPK
jgi:hypothetical protein